MSNDTNASERVPAEIRPCWHMTIRHRAGMPPELWCETCGMWRAVERPSDDVILPLSLTQRILAALEECGEVVGPGIIFPRHTDLADELRAVIPTADPRKGP